MPQSGLRLPSLVLPEVGPAKSPGPGGHLGKRSQSSLDCGSSHLCPIMVPGLGESALSVAKSLIDWTTDKFHNLGKPQLPYLEIRITISAS